MTKIGTSLKDLAALAASADSVSIVGVATDSYASPEGEISLNENLAMDRAKSANKAVTKALGQKRHLNSKSCRPCHAQGEDWEGFKKAMRASSIADKDLILRVLEMYSDKNKREEEEIKNIAKTYKEIEEGILPDLRRSQVAVTYTIEGYTDEELMDLVQNQPRRPDCRRAPLQAPPCSQMPTTSWRCTKTARVHADDLPWPQQLRGDLDGRWSHEASWTPSMQPRHSLQTTAL